LNREAPAVFEGGTRQEQKKRHVGKKTAQGHTVTVNPSGEKRKYEEWKGCQIQNSKRRGALRPTMKTLCNRKTKIEKKTAKEKKIFKKKGDINNLGRSSGGSRFLAEGKSELLGQKDSKSDKRI